MARGRSHRNSASSADTTDNARDVLDALLEPLPGPPLDPVSAIDDLMAPVLPFDARAFDFDQRSMVHDAVTRAEVVSAGDGRRRDVLAPVMSERVARSDGRRTAICVRRSQRREVLHALDRVRRGRGGSKRRDWRSDIKC